MKLTDEMRAELDELLTGIFMDGYRMGQRGMRERAAKEVESTLPRPMLVYADVAANIRALSTEE